MKGTGEQPTNQPSKQALAGETKRLAAADSLSPLGNRSRHFVCLKTGRWRVSR